MAPSPSEPAASAGPAEPSRLGPRIAVASCAELPGLDEESALVLPALRERGADAEPQVWDDPDVDWAGYDAVVVRGTWDYAPRRAEFLAWAARVEAATTLLNPLPLLEWSSDKHYLADLAAAGLPVVPSTLLEVGDGDDHPHLDVEHVVKPAVSAGSRGALRLGADEPERSRAHVRSLHAAGLTALVQPYLVAVDDVGETGLIHLDGAFSHAIRKGPLLRRGGGLVQGLFAEEERERREPSAAELEVGRAAVALAAARAGGEAPVYARVDLLPGDDGSPLLLELELVEPSLFLEHEAGAAVRLADAVLRRLGRPR